MGESKLPYNESSGMTEFFEKNPGPVLRLNAQGIILLANIAAARVFENDKGEEPNSCDKEHDRYK